MFKSNGQATREKLVADINTLVADTDQLLKCLAEEGSSQAAEVRARIEQNLQVTKARLNELEQSVVLKAKGAAQAANGYARSHPWQTLGVTAGLGVLVGFLLRRH